MDTPYFNAGVMVLHLGRWRSEDVAPAIIEFQYTNGQSTKQSDQDGLNAILAGKWGQLDPRWNVLCGAVRYPDMMPSSLLKDEIADRRDRFARGGCILHFAGYPKPWHSGPSGAYPIRVVYRRRYFSTLRRSGWFSPIEYTVWYLKWLMWALVQAYQCETARWRG